MRSLAEGQADRLDLVPGDAVRIEAAGVSAEHLGVQARRRHVQHHVVAGAEAPAARERGVCLLALPEACLGGYLSVLGRGRDGEFDESPDSLPPVMDVDGPELKRVAELARDMTVVVGFCEADNSERYNSAAIVTGEILSTSLMFTSTTARSLDLRSVVQRPGQM